MAQKIAQLKCPKCGQVRTRVLDCYANSEFTAIRRRRACSMCAHRFTTFEIVCDRYLGDDRENKRLIAEIGFANEALQL